MKKTVRIVLAAVGFTLAALLVASCDSKTEVKPADSEYECKDGKCYPKPKKLDNQLGK